MWSRWRLFFCIAVFLCTGSEVFAQQATPTDYTTSIRTVSGLNADGLENKSFRDEYCKPLPPREGVSVVAIWRRLLTLDADWSWP
jgi:hypothetical protein